MGKMKNKNKKRNTLYSILDSNYFHICVENKEKNSWKVYYKNLPSAIYFSEKNKALLTSKENTINDIYKLRQKFEIEKSKEFRKNMKEYININKEISYFLLKLKQLCSYILTDFFLINLIVSIINLVFIINTKFAILHFALVTFIAILETYRIMQIQDLIKKSQEKIKEAFIKEKIKRQGLYFVQRLKGGKDDF